MKTIAILLAASSMTICTPRTGPDPIPIEPVPVDPVPATSDCSTACDNMRRLGCEEGETTDEGATCEMWCENAARSPAPLPVACMTRAQSCEAAGNCGR